MFVRDFSVEFNAILEQIARTNEELQHIVRKHNCPNHEGIAIDIRRDMAAIPEKPAYIDGMKRRLEVFNAASEMAHEVLGRYVAPLALMAFSPILMLAVAGLETANTIIECARESELIRQIQFARREIEYVNNFFSIKFIIK